MKKPIGSIPETLIGQAVDSFVSALRGIIRDAVTAAMPTQAPRQEEPPAGKLPELLRFKDVKAALSVSATAWYKGVKEGRFPKPVKIGRRLVAWRRSDIERLISQGTASGTGEEGGQ